MQTKSLTRALLSVGSLLVAAAFVPGSFAQSAQDQSTPPAAAQPAPQARKHGEGRLSSLGLTDDQKSQISQIHQDAKTKADAVRADNSLSDADKRAKLEAIHHAAKKQVRGVLTPEQRQQLRAQRKAKIRERRAANAPSVSM